MPACEIFLYSTFLNIYFRNNYTKKNHVMINHHFSFLFIVSSKMLKNTNNYRYCGQNVHEQFPWKWLYEF